MSGNMKLQITQAITYYKNESIFVDQLLQYLLKDYIKEGWLQKTGPNKGDAFRKRWFILESRKLMYFDEPMVKRH